MSVVYGFRSLLACSCPAYAVQLLRLSNARSFSGGHSDVPECCGHLSKAPSDYIQSSSDVTDASQPMLAILVLDDTQQAIARNGSANIPLFIVDGTPPVPQANSSESWRESQQDCANHCEMPTVPEETLIHEKSPYDASETPSSSSETDLSTSLPSLVHKFSPQSSSPSLSQRFLTPTTLRLPPLSPHSPVPSLLLSPSLQPPPPSPPPPLRTLASSVLPPLPPSTPSLLPPPPSASTPELSQSRPSPACGDSTQITTSRMLSPMPLSVLMNSYPPPVADSKENVPPISTTAHFASPVSSDPSHPSSFKVPLLPQSSLCLSDPSFADPVPSSSLAPPTSRPSSSHVNTTLPPRLPSLLSPSSSLPSSSFFPPSTSSDPISSSDPNPRILSPQTLLPLPILQLSLPLPPTSSLLSSSSSSSSAQLSSSSSPSSLPSSLPSQPYPPPSPPFHPPEIPSYSHLFIQNPQSVPSVPSFSSPLTPHSAHSPPSRPLSFLPPPSLSPDPPSNSDRPGYRAPPVDVSTSHFPTGPSQFQITGISPQLRHEYIYNPSEFSSVEHGGASPMNSNMIDQRLVPRPFEIPGFKAWASLRKFRFNKVL
ncbi:hypothetical protein AB6A40_003823 [Gnathostoma spinigerum]|uniref:Uncharacterized protein n=1 Tax=Gnathostoma spinigerum TaxID=75299 RepID=A0ABD6EAN1_9BILA